MAFEMVVVGSGGGPDETNLSGYLLKPRNASWRDGIIALEGGAQSHNRVWRPQLTLSSLRVGCWRARTYLEARPIHLQ